MPERREIDDGETSVRQADILVDPAPGRIWSAMNKRSVHF
jgi:hypothetical protein